MISIISNTSIINAKLHENYSFIYKGLKLKSIESKNNSIALHYNKKKLIFTETTIK